MSPFPKPATPLGRWSVVLAAAFLVLWLINTFVFMPWSDRPPWWSVYMPFYGITMMATGLVSGVCGLVAVLRQRERSRLVWIPLLFGLLLLFFLAGELLLPH